MSVSRDLSFAAGVVRKKPFSCLLQLTNRCNMKCSFCDFWPNGSKKDELTLDEYAKFEKDLTAMGTFLISLEGGEPMLRPDLVDIVRLFSRKHISALFTNGWYVTAENAQALFDAGMEHASVSIDYPDAKRHDAKRVLADTTERAWRAVDHFIKAAPQGGRQVHLTTVIMDDNADGLEELVQQSAARGIGHWFTLLAVKGYRRGVGPDKPPSPEVALKLQNLWKRYPHIRTFRNYFRKMEAFLSGGEMPVCRAGLQSFNLDHAGNVSPCIEKIDKIAGNVRTESLQQIHEKLKASWKQEVSDCQDCWTLCRATNQHMGNGGSLTDWWDLSVRMRPGA